MKVKISLAAALILIILTSFSEQARQQAGQLTSEEKLSSLKKLNFFIISKRKKGKFDPATRFNVLRTKMKSLVRPGHFVAIVASDVQEASNKILNRLKKNNARIGTIWFDSHGMYKKGYSLFMVGHDEISYKTLKDSSVNTSFELLVPYTDRETKLVIGSCYGGATYTRLSIDYKDTTRMNGDSLMMALGNFFTKSKIYASESWVMTKPGLFNENKSAVAGYPKRKLFRDICYQPAWENLGKWNEYDAASSTFHGVNPVALNSYGSLRLAKGSFAEKKETKKDIYKNLSKLEPDLYK